MEREVSTSVGIATSLIAIGVVLNIVFFTVFIGNQMKGDAFSFIDRIRNDMNEGLLSEMVGNQNEMPAATAYSLMRNYGNLIPETECLLKSYDTNHVSGQKVDLTIEPPCLKSHLHHNVSLEVIKVGDGEYNIKIHYDECPWWVDGEYCECDSLQYDD